MKPLAIQMETENWGKGSEGYGTYKKGEWHGSYYLPAVAVEHPTETIPGRQNLMLLNDPAHGMLQDEAKVLEYAIARRDTIIKAFDACEQLSFQELDWVVATIKAKNY